MGVGGPSQPKRFVKTTPRLRWSHLLWSFRAKRFLLGLISRPKRFPSTGGHCPGPGKFIGRNQSASLGSNF